MNESMECIICFEGVQLDDSIYVLNCCATQSSATIAHKPCLDNWQNKEDLNDWQHDTCIHCNNPKRYTTLELNSKSLIDNHDAFTPQAYSGLLHSIKINPFFTQPDAHGKTFVEYFHGRIPRQSPKFDATYRFLTDRSTDILNQNNLGQSEKVQTSHLILKCTILNPQLQLDEARLKSFWSAKDYIPNIVPEALAIALYKICAPNPEYSDLRIAYECMKKVPAYRNLLGFAFMVKIHLALNQTKQAVEICKTLLHAPIHSDLTGVNTACQQFAFHTLQAHNATDNGPYQLYQAQHLKAGDPIDAATKAIATHTDPMVPEGFALLRKLLPKHADDVQLKSIITLAIHCLRAKKYCSDLRAILDQYRLTLLFQKPYEEYQKGQYFGSFFHKSQNDLTEYYADTLFKDNNQIDVQGVRFTRFMSKLDMRKVASIVKTRYDEAKTGITSRNCLTRNY